MEAWRGFKNGIYQTQIDVRNFIQTNYTPYEGDSAFLAGPTERTKALMKKVNALLKEEQDKGGDAQRDARYSWLRAECHMDGFADGVPLQDAALKHGADNAEQGKQE